jgi:hypothetical protein
MTYPYWHIISIIVLGAFAATMVALIAIDLHAQRRSHRAERELWRRLEEDR